MAFKLEKTYGPGALALKVSAKGPATDVDVAAAGTASIELTAENPFIHRGMVASIASIQGLPEDLALLGFSTTVSDGKVTVAVNVRNLNSAAAVTVSTNTLIADVVLLG